MRHSRFYEIFNNLQRRCNSPKNNRYNSYGGRGIRCEWKNFEEFKNEMLESYLYHCEYFGEKNTQIDRINNDGNYCLKNCKWATRIEQMRTQQKTIKITINNEIKSFREWCGIYGLNYKTVIYQYRYAKKKKTIEQIFKIKS